MITMDGSKQPAWGGLMLGALGVVYGDIGTSPLYALREAIRAAGDVGSSEARILGALSLIFWALLLIVTVKYVIFIMRADHDGEGGIMALLALALETIAPKSPMRAPLLVMGLAGTALFYGDGMITPAISVLSAVEGLEVATPLLKPVVVPLTLLVLVGLFAFQHLGTAKVGRLFGPILLVWFLVIGLTGLNAILEHPEVLRALDPAWGLRWIIDHPGVAMPVLGGVFLAVTGGEALYADMGHFGPAPIRLVWLGLVLPMLLLNYFGQGALLLGDPQAITHPFFHLVPAWGRLPMVILAAAATVIASQAVISGAFSATSQAMRLGFLPRMSVVHTSARHAGQIYLPAVNRLLMIGVLLLVLIFRSSEHLAAAYGIAVTGTMVATSLLAFGVVLPALWKLPKPLTLALLALFLSVDLAFLVANSLKILDGGWFPLVLGLLILGLMHVWQWGREQSRRAIQAEEIPLEPFLRQFERDPPLRVDGVAVYLAARPDTVPHALLQNLRHNWVLHQHVIILTLVNAPLPRVPEAERFHQTPLPLGVHKVSVAFGFMESPEIPAMLESCRFGDFRFDAREGSFFLSRAHFVARERSDERADWRLGLFISLSRHMRGAASYFRIPHRNVVEMGLQIEL
ncbi:MAG: KUP/HAK/KT family potassium transporter [Magnetococcales bacterium]|nr:KUP/HAK/KT family potassium transporter [Magnetococcales bacterium]